MAQNPTKSSYHFDEKSDKDKNFKKIIQSDETEGDKNENPTSEIQEEEIIARFFWRKLNKFFLSF